MATNPNITKEGIEVLPGQIWEDLDKRMKNRLVRIESVENGKCRVVGRALSGGNYGGKSTQISVRRMHKHSTGWKKIS